MQIEIVSLHDLQLMLDRAAERVIEAVTDKSELHQQTDRWFDLNELCSYHPDKTSPATVYGWVQTGLIPCHKGQKKLRFLKSEIDNWLKQGRKKTLVETANEADNYLQNHKKRGAAMKHHNPPA